MRKQNIYAMVMTVLGLGIGLYASSLDTKSNIETHVVNTVKSEKTEEKKQIDLKYKNPGIIKCDGYVNLRTSPSLDGDINVIASVDNLTLCDILTEYDQDWYQVSFGDISGYILKKYVVTGDELNDLAEYADMTVKTVKKDTLEYRDPFKGYMVNGVFNSREASVDGIIMAGSQVTTLKYNDDFDILLDGEDIKYIDTDNTEVYKNIYRTLDGPKKQMSFISEFTNFGVSVNDTIIEIKDSPSDNGVSIGILLPHSSLEVINKQDEWTEMSSGKVHGYIKTEYVMDGDAAKEYGVKHSKLKAFTSDIEENVYSEKSMLGKKWDKLGKNQVYDVLERDGYWIKVDLGSGDNEGDSLDAYVNIEDESVSVKYSLNVALPYLDMLGNTEAPPEKINEKNLELRYKVIDYACQFIGNPYVWGGTSLTNGADCSGYVQAVLKNFGIYIPRVSRDQAQVGIPVESADKLQPGDLIFYANSNGTVNHVAMYIGNGMIVNAGSRKSGILINTYNYRTPVAMRNVIGDRVR